MLKRRPLIVVLTIISIASSAVPPAVAAQGAGAAPQATAAAAPADGDWPRAYDTSTGAKVVLYQPQVGLWPEQTHMTLFAAVSYIARDGATPALGTLKIESDTSVAVDDRLVSFSEFTITQANFETLPKDQLGAVVAEIKAAVPREERVIGLDRVLAMVQTSDVKAHNTAGIKADPPPVFFSQTPAVLVNFDGNPIWSPIEANELQFAINTNWDVFQYPPDGSLFLRVEGEWLKAASIGGPWKAAGALPESFSRLPDNGNWTDVKSALPGKPIPSGAMPIVFTSTKPAELILLTGAPAYSQVAGTNLQWVSNTESDVFREGHSGAVYFLVAGRWFSAPDFTGPWTFATPTLPSDFKRIPLEHPRSRVLASVPGTRQAIEAMLLAQIPQTAAVKRQLQAPDVAYSGEPQFVPIEQTMISRAANTDKDILRVGDMYYMCFQGVWFRSTNPDGPWEVTDSVPKDVYDIPISSPAHEVTYVTVQSSDDDEVVFMADAAYMGMMVGWGCAVWGSGWYYPPYYYGGGYYPGFPTYGYGASYNPWTGAFTRGGVAYGPYGGAGYAARYNPRTGTYSRGVAAYGPGGARGAAAAWNPRTGTAAATRQGSNVYGSWGSTSVQRGDQWASTSRVTNRQTGTTTRATQGSGGGGAVTRNGPVGTSGIARTGSGDVYAGRDGNVYRNDGSGWQTFDNGSWKSTDRQAQGANRSALQGSIDSATRDQLNRDRASRGDGAQRTMDLGTIRSGSGGGGGSWGGAGSYRPSGGGMRSMPRGGGGRRR